MKNIYFFLCLSLAFSEMEIDTLWTFTNYGQTGRFGPTLEHCESAYSGTSLERQITMDDLQGSQKLMLVK